MAALCFEDVEIIGADIPRIVTGPMSAAHIVRWSASMENRHRIHYDWRYATAHDGPPDVMVNGSWKQHVMLQLLTDWVGESGWPWKLSFQFCGMTVPGDTLSAWGRMTAIEPPAQARAPVAEPLAGVCVIEWSACDAGRVLRAFARRPRCTRAEGRAAGRR